jgi:hypothetical protein
VNKPDRPSAAIQAVDRACQRSAAVVHVEMNEGLNILATNACIAPWIGLFGTVVGMVNSFLGCGGEKSACLAATTAALSRSIWPTALGLLSGLISLWFYRYLSGRMESIDTEMASASLDLANQLTRYRGHFESAAIASPIELPTFGVAPEADSARRPSWLVPLFEKYVADVGQDLRSWLRSVVLSLAALVIAWCARAAEYFFYESIPFDSAARTASVFVLIMFGISCFYAVFYRRSAGALVLGSILCLCLNLIELTFRVHLF